MMPGEKSTTFKMKETEKKKKKASGPHFTIIEIYVCLLNNIPE